MFSRHFTKTLLSATALGLLGACAVLDKKDTAEPSNWFVSLFEKDGQSYADKATLEYSAGNFEKTLEYATQALKENPRNQKALLIGALASEKLGRYNRARQYYEDLILIDGNETSLLGSPNNQPQKISETAKKNLRAITIAQSNLTIENRDGSKNFAISKEAGAKQNKTTITKALNKKKAATPKKPVGIDGLFSYAEQNAVSRFLILKELAEKDFITKEEFLSRRSANIGALLPLTHQAPGVGINQPVPSADLIIERLEILKEGTETRAITPREFSAERDVIIEALMSPSPRHRMKNKAPSKNILDAANDLRRLEVLYDLNLITETEKEAEKKAVEKYLGINTAPQPQQPSAAQPAATLVPPQPVVAISADSVSTQPAPENAKQPLPVEAPVIVETSKVVVLEKPTEPLKQQTVPTQPPAAPEQTAPAQVSTPQALSENKTSETPAVSSPFNK